MPRWMLFVLTMLVGVAGCRTAAPLPTPAAMALPTPAPGSPRSVADVRAAQAALLGQRVTVVGVVTSVEGGWLTLQSGGAALLLPAPADSRLAQEILVTGTLGQSAGALALVALEEVAVERPSATLPVAAPLTLEAGQESLFVEALAPTVDEAGRLRLADGRTLAVGSSDAETVRRLAPGTRLDAVRGVLRRDGAGWWLLPTHPRDVLVAPPLRTLCEIQGRARQSPFQGERVEVVGLVTLAVAGDEPGFFLQQPACDSDPDSADALFVVGAATVERGARVRLRGRVEERFGRTQLALEEAALHIEAQGQPLPRAVPVAPPADGEAARDYWESLEGMRVALAEAQAVAPTSRFGEFAVVAAAHLPPGGHVLRLGGAAGRLVTVGALGAAAPDVAVGDGLRGLDGVLDFSFGTFKLQLLSAPTLVAGPRPLPPPIVLAPGHWSVATLNVENLFDTVDDPARADEASTPTEAELAARLDKLAATIAGPLALPTVLALQEVETLPLLERLAAHPALGGQYEALLLEGHDARGIDQALLVARGRIKVVAVAQADPCAPLAAPGGGGAVGCPPGEQRLFARPPLVAELRLDGRETLYVVVVHFKSKSGGEAESRPRRVAQGRHVAALARTLAQAAPSAALVVLGDFNDDERSATLAEFADGPLHNLWETVPVERRYAYIFAGQAQVLDHLLVSEDLQRRLIAFRPLPLNADFPHALHHDPQSPFRTSDHDPLVAIFAAPEP